MNVSFEQPFEPKATRAYASPINDNLVLKSDAFNPLWFVSDIRIPAEVAEGGAVDVEVDVRNEQVAIAPFSDNICRDGLTSGFESQVTVNPDWTASDSTTVCTRVGGLSATVDTVAFDFPAPDSPGTYSVDVEVVGAETGVGGTATFEVFVPGPDDGDDGPGGRPGAGDPDGGEITIPGGSGEPLNLPFLDTDLSGTAALGVLVVLLFLFLAVSVAS